MKLIIRKNLFLVILLLLTFSSCKEKENKTIIAIETDTSSISEKPLSFSEIEADNSVEKKKEEKYVNTDFQEAKVQIEKEFGKQWDFCTCIIKSDSVNTALLSTDDDEEFDKIMERSEFIDSKCKELLIHPNTTPEDRYEHEKRVKKCLAKANL